MISRLLETTVFDPSLGRQMRFISGPRQTGKTTLLQNLLKLHHTPNLYYNWDGMKTRERFAKDREFYWSDFKKYEIPNKKKPWIAFDEIQKMPKWRNILKGMFDTYWQEMFFAVAGSARLDYLRKGGDSLAGRFFSFNLLPLTLFEVTAKKGAVLKPAKDPVEFIESRISGEKSHQAGLESLMAFSGFPEPFLKAENRFLDMWHHTYVERLTQIDLRDLTKISSLDSVGELLWLLPSRIGSPLSINSLRQDLSVHHKTVQNYLNSLSLLYVIFSIKSYQKRISRSVKKARKFYFTDWTLIAEEAPRFENFVASELNAWLSFWNDTGLGKFELFYVRKDNGKETDFLITNQNIPWLLVEAKLSSEQIETHHQRHAEELGEIPFVQIVQKPNILRKTNKKSYVVSADRFFGQ